MAASKALCSVPAIVIAITVPVPVTIPGITSFSAITIAINITTTTTPTPCLTRFGPCPTRRPTPPDATTPRPT